MGENARMDNFEIKLSKKETSDFSSVSFKASNIVSVVNIMLILSDLLQELSSPDPVRGLGPVS